MVGSFFYAHNQGMDILKLFEKVIQNEEVKAIPLIDVFTVICCVVEAIGSGDCFYPADFD